MLADPHLGRRVDAGDQHLGGRRRALRQDVDPDALGAQRLDRGGGVAQVLAGVGQQHQLAGIAVGDDAGRQPQRAADVGVARVGLGLEDVEARLAGRRQFDLGVVAEGDHAEEVVGALGCGQGADVGRLAVEAVAGAGAEVDDRHDRPLVGVDGDSNPGQGERQQRNQRDPERQ